MVDYIEYSLKISRYENNLIEENIVNLELSLREESFLLDFIVDRIFGDYKSDDVFRIESENITNEYGVDGKAFQVFLSGAFDELFRSYTFIKLLTRRKILSYIWDESNKLRLEEKN
jgi:hypothetical protein